jgi:transcriptional regulator GlxA family with amidase domain
VAFVGETAGLKRTDTGFLAINADAPIAEVGSPDVLVVPGGPGSRAIEQNRAVLDWIRKIDRGSRFTTSVCTGSLILGAAGLLKGLNATSHWAQLEELRKYGAQPTAERVVEQGRIVTAAGVSSGIDMALTIARRIAGDDFAQAIQLGIEYDPKPPFDAGSPQKVSPHIVALVRQALDQASA